IGDIPSAPAVISAGKQAAVFAICLNCWIAWHVGDRLKFAGWLALSLVFPIVTVLGSGFLGYGIAWVILVLTFVGLFYRPRWQLVAAGIAAVYFGLSLYVAYVQSRDAIRESVWGGESLEKRINVGLDMLARIQLFDFGNATHLDWVDWRLNQNELLGIAIGYTPTLTPFLYGQTITDAAIAVIPRAIW